MEKPRIYLLRESGVLERIVVESKVPKGFNLLDGFTITSSTCIHVQGKNGDVYPKPPDYKLKPGEEVFNQRKSDRVYVQE